MTTSKFRRAYSLRIPHSPKPAVFLDSSGYYDRLEEPEYQDDLQSLSETNRDSTNFSWDVPLITDAPKLQHCRKKWCSKSLRVPKTRLADTGPPTSQKQEVSEMDGNSSDSFQDPDVPTLTDVQKQSSDSQGQDEQESEGEKQKCKKMKHYKKTFDRALRRGWENFITNIYTISLTRTSQEAPHLVKAC